MRRLAAFVVTVPLLILCPVLIIIAAAAIFICDFLWLIVGRRRPPRDTAPDRRSASIVIPNWNGRDLLERYLPSVVAAAAAVPGSEVIVVDNGSTDGSAEFVRNAFPAVRLLALKENLGFGGGSNAGVRAAMNDVVVLLNSDMRVEPNFLPPLLEGFRDERVFAVACQIFLSDPTRKREETGLTQGAWRDGALRVRHLIDAAITGPYPCFYGGGGSCAFDRRKFLELGGFDPLLRPFYLEDTDLGYQAWKRGWQVLYQPQSIVYHEHRGTIGRHFTREYIEGVYKKNFVLFAWKNIHEWRKIAAQLATAAGDSLVSALFGDSPERTNARGVCRAFVQLPAALASRWRTRSLAAVSDTEAFRRPLGGYFRDRFQLDRVSEMPERLRVLFVSPYPICPPVHGGAVFMHSTLRELVRTCEVHLVCILDDAKQEPAHGELARCCFSAEYVVRGGAVPRSIASALPHAVREFKSEDLEWLIHRQMYTKAIDVVQLEYTPMAQYAGAFQRIATAVFEHDVYFQSIGRALRRGGITHGRITAAYEYLRALRYELSALRRIDQIQVCTAANGEYLASFVPAVVPRMRLGLRAGVDVATYPFQDGDREPYTMLFIGSYRHLPNQTALAWFVSNVMPRVVRDEPRARLVVVGSEIPPHQFSGPHIELRGFVDDVREPLGRYSVFVCPVRSGSGVRVKLLEAFASGIPTVSTRLGAEGLAASDGEICALADDPASTADRILGLFANPAAGRLMASRARREVEANWNTAAITRRLVASYLELVATKRGAKARDRAAISA